MVWKRLSFNSIFDFPDANGRARVKLLLEDPIEQSQFERVLRFYQNNFVIYRNNFVIYRPNFLVYHLTLVYHPLLISKMVIS